MKICYTLKKYMRLIKEDSMEYSVLKFGAAGDGHANDTAAIQAAIDACRAAGGGRVILPGGHIYRSGALVLCSNLELHIGMGAVLKGSDDLSDYVLFGDKTRTPEDSAVPSYENCEYDGAPGHYFLYAKGCTNVAITGLGAIDGNEQLFYGEVNRWHIEGRFYPRAPLIFIEDTERLTIRDVTLRSSAFWTVHLVGCRNVLVSGVRILNNLRMANCDGIDPDHCQNVRISDCHIECADDCIVFKNTAAAMKYGPCENITVSNCTLMSTSAAIKFGTESEALFRNILVQNCVIRSSNRGISIQLRDKGSIENVSFQNIAIDTRLFHPEMYWGQAEPIAVTVLPRKPDTAVGTVRGLSFRDIMATGENGILLYGERPGDIRDLRFEGVCVHIRAVTDYEKGRHDLRPTSGAHETERGLHYVFARNVTGASFTGCRFTSELPIDSVHHIDACEDITL